MFQKQKLTQGVTQAEDSPPLTPQDVIARLRALQLQIPEIAPLTLQKRRTLQQFARVPEGIVHATITMIGVSDGVQHAIGADAEDVRLLVDGNVGWGAVENELKAMLRGIADANLVRRQRGRITVAQALGIGKQMARTSENAALRPHLDEVRRLRALANRRKPAVKSAESQTPSSKPADPVTDGASTAPGGDSDRK